MCFGIRPKTTQYRHFTNVLHATGREDPVEKWGLKTYRPAAVCVLVYIKTELRELSREKRLVYGRALKDDEDRSPIRIQLGNLSGAVLCPYSGGRTSDKISLPWLAPILSCEMVSRETLSSILRGAGWPKEAMPKFASTYLLFRLDELSKTARRVISSLAPQGSYQAISRTLSDLNECPEAV